MKNMKREEILKKIREVLIDHKWVRPRKKVWEKNNFYLDFDMDSIDMVEITMDIEKDLAIEITDEEVEKIDTVADLADIIEKKLKETHNL